MSDKINDKEHSDDTEALLSRRAILKTLAAAPLVVTFGLVASPLMRFLKPTMKPLNFIQAADFPSADPPPQFHVSDFPDIWTCLPFMLPLKYLEFNPEQYEIRKAPGFVIRVAENQIVAFSRICPVQGDHILSFVHPTASGSCGCSDDDCIGKCIGYRKTPYLFCPCDDSVFDLSNNGRVIAGPATRPPRQFTVIRDADWVSIGRLVQVGIA